ncbi:MAG: hypothetical protein ACK5PP_01420 [Acidimicrobiales bacterium]
MVKLLVATTEAQGNRSDDYAWAVDGELVYIPDGTCDCEVCGCTSGFAGMASARSSTTALVVDRPDLRPEDLSGALADSLERQGWTPGVDPEVDAELLAHLLARLRAAADHFPPGAVLERRGDIVRRRAQVEPIPLPTPLAGD